jgi:type III restriction enzyme
MTLAPCSARPLEKRPVSDSFFAYPSRHWDLDEYGQPTQRVIDTRRSAKFVTLIPKPKRRKASVQKEIIFVEGKGLSDEVQQYDPTSIINEVRSHVDSWRSLPNPSQWQVTPETARLLWSAASSRHPSSWAILRVKQ